jgi:hypothetical protein
VNHRPDDFRISRDAALRSARSLDMDGSPWTVYEIRASQYDRRGESSLIFETDGVVRRVRNFPANWRDLSDAELRAISRQA